VRKVLLTAVAAAVALGSFAVISQAGKGVGGTSWNFAYKPGDTDKPVKTDSLIFPAIKMDDGSYAETKKTTIFFTPTTEFDTSVPPRCTASGGELVSSNGAVCDKAQIGQGDALAQVGTLETAAELKAYNRKSGIYFLVTSCNPGTGPGQEDPNCTPLEGGTFALVGKLKYADKAKQKPFLVVPTPQTLLDGNIIITKFHLETDRVVKKGETYIESPEVCKRGKFKTKAKIEYETPGVDNQIIKDSQAC
jgi:hypothetical protein